MQNLRTFGAILGREMQAIGTKSKKHRRNLVLPETSMARIRYLREQTDAETDTEVIRRALKVYERVVQLTEGGTQLQLLQNGKTVALEIL